MGFNLGQFVNILKLVAPAVLAASGVPPALIPVAIHGIELAESKPASGAEKKAVALDAVATALAGINAVKPGAVDPHITQVVSNGIDVAVDTVKIIQNKAPAVAPAI